jgi:hypothetical protein
MANRDHGGGLSLDASVRIEGAGRPRLERLLRMAPARLSRGMFGVKAAPKIRSMRAPSRILAPKPASGRLQRRFSTKKL